MSGEARLPRRPRLPETPLDAGADSVYDLTVQVDDGNWLTDTQAHQCHRHGQRQRSDHHLRWRWGFCRAQRRRRHHRRDPPSPPLTPTCPRERQNYSIVVGTDHCSPSMASPARFDFLAAPDAADRSITGTDNVCDVTVQADDGAGRTDTRPSPSR
ncbi:MAG: hypothetical protein R3E48_16735 [Burkholderiaceae bacterium]